MNNVTSRLPPFPPPKHYCHILMICVIAIKSKQRTPYAECTKLFEIKIQIE